MKTKTTVSALATLAAASSSPGAVVQIALSGISLTPTSNTLTADFSGDGTHDFTISGVRVVSQSNGFTQSQIASVNLNGVLVRAYSYAYQTGMGIYPVGSTIGSLNSAGGGLEALIPISFNDDTYGGAIEGFLEVNTSNGGPQIDLLRIIFDDENLSVRPDVAASDPDFPTATPVPEVSSLALLALGAGGLLARRRRAA